jgi:oligoribonuclease
LKADNLIWVDLEMTGLDTQADHIIEIATIVTDSSLRILAEGPVIAIYQDDAVLGAMDEWNRTTHGGTGLLQRVRDSRFSAKDAETLTLDFLTAHAVAGASPMCGNSICQDRRFLAREMPALERYFH